MQDGETDQSETVEYRGYPVRQYFEHTTEIALRIKFPRLQLLENHSGFVRQRTRNKGKRKDDDDQHGHQRRKRRQRTPPLQPYHQPAVQGTEKHGDYRPPHDRSIKRQQYPAESNGDDYKQQKKRTAFRIRRTVFIWRLHLLAESIR